MKRVFYVNFNAMTGGAMTQDFIKLKNMSDQFNISEDEYKNLLRIITKGRDNRIIQNKLNTLGIRLLVEDLDGHTLFEIDNEAHVLMNGDVFSLLPISYLEMVNNVIYLAECHGDPNNNILYNHEGVTLVVMGYLSGNNLYKFNIKKGKYIIKNSHNIWIIECNDGKMKLKFEISKRDGRLISIIDMNLNEKFNRILR